MVSSDENPELTSVVTLKPAIGRVTAARSSTIVKDAFRVRLFHIPGPFTFISFSTSLHTFRLCYVWLSEFPVWTRGVK